MPGGGREVPACPEALGEVTEMTVMRMNKVVIAVLVLTAMVFSGELAAEERQGPRISVKEARYDLGKVDQGGQPEHVFEIKNVGDELLEIKQIQPT